MRSIPANTLVPPKAPSLPVGPVEYDQRYVDQLNNVLRIYFNELDNSLQALLTATGGSLLRFPNGAFHQDGYTTLTTTISTPTSTANIVVASTSGFLSSGTLLIDTELIGYTGKTATTFTGITRSKYGSSGASHTAGVYVSEAQAVASTSTALAIALTATDVSNQISIDSTDNTKVVYAVPGYYNIQFSVQLLNFDGTIDNVTFWFKQNGADIANSAGIVSVPAIHGGVAGATIVSWNLVIPVNAGDNTQLYMASNTGNTVASTYPPGVSPTRPASPSVILTATFVSALY